MATFAQQNLTGNYSSVANFFHDRSVFVTGGTGFMGKVLVEKLLRSCPGIKKIYLLMRPKRGQDIHARLGELIESPVSETDLFICFKEGWRKAFCQEFYYNDNKFYLPFFKT